MHIRELTELKEILYFEGEYALFRALDEQGTYYGAINRSGEIVWNDHWRQVVVRVQDYPHIMKTHSEGLREELFYDVEAHAFVASSVIKTPEKSKAQMMVDQAPRVPYIEGVPELGSYATLYYLSEQYLGFHSDEGEWGVQDLDGNIILPALFQSVSGGKEPNHFVVHWKDKQGVIDDQGQWIIPAEYDSIYWRRAYYVVYANISDKERKCGLLDAEGKVLIPFEYDFLFPSPTEDLISVKKDGECFFINSKNEKIHLF